MWHGEIIAVSLPDKWLMGTAVSSETTVRFDKTEVVTSLNNKKLEHINVYVLRTGVEAKSVPRLSKFLWLLWFQIHKEIFIFFISAGTYIFKFGDVMCRKFIHEVWSDLIRPRTMKRAKHVARVEEKKRHIGIWWRNLQEGNKLIDLGVDGRKYKKWVSKK